MKQNKTYKILTGLTLVTILTTTVIGSTMANFTSASDVNDSAKVAVCNLAVTGEDLFNKSYISDVKELKESSTYTVKADNKTLAPGTRNEVFLKVNGETEVYVDATHSIDVEFDGDWVDGDGNFYCPIEFKIIRYNSDTTKDEYTVSGSTYTSKQDLLDALAANVCHSTYRANAAFQDYIPVSISWNWPFSSSEANNAKDTALMNKSLTNKIGLTIKCKTQFTQID